MFVSSVASAVKMQFICYLCKKYLSTVGTVTRHLRSDHALFPSSNLSLKCCVNSCLLAFRTYSGLRKHLKKHISIQNTDSHSPPTKQMKIGESSVKMNETPLVIEIETEKLSSEPDFPDPVSVASNSSLNNDNENIFVEDDDDDDLSVEHDLLSSSSTTLVETDSTIESNNENILDDASVPSVTQYILKLEATGMPKSLLQTVVDSTTELINDVVDKVLNFLEENNIQTDDSVLNYLNEHKKLLGSFSTNYKRNNYYTSLSDYVKPVELSIGTRFDQVFDKSANIYKTVALPCTYMYIPILETLAFILQNDNVLDMVISEHDEVEGMYKDIHHGSYYKNHPFFNRLMPTLQLQLYYDEFETTNPLGSKTNAHKLGGIYFILRNLLPEFNSKLQNIHLIALFYAPDLKTCGFSEILKPIIRDIKLLETAGIQIKNGIIRGTIIALSFDNLGGNTVLGLVESFSAHYFCRLCTATKEETRTMCKERLDLLRTIAGYERICNDLSDQTVHLFGIKAKSILNDLLHFNVIDSSSVDIMHDILEGVAQYEVKLFLNFIVNVLKLIKLHQLNDRIRAFNYGTIDIKNKPSPIVLDKPGVLIGQRAAQTWCLVRYLPLIIGDLVVPSHAKYDLLKEKWGVLTLLLKCMDIIFSPIITTAMIAELRVLIEEHHASFQTQFEKHLIPKHHFMLHYSTVIERMGPLIFLWSMRFEGKHNYFKDLARKYCNFKNIAKTLANQHQRYMYFHWKVCTKELEARILPGSGKLRKYQYVVDKYSLQNSGIKIPLSAEVLVVDKVDFHFLYKTGFFIVSHIDKDSDLPIFQNIMKIIIYENVPFAVCMPWKTTAFNQYYHSFSISPETENYFNVINLKFLQHQTTYEHHQSFGAIDYYIVPKHRII